MARETKQQKDTPDRQEQHLREASQDHLPEKIRLRDVTALAGEHDLRAFIASEARRNRHLAMRMKARFIDDINLRSGINKYAVLLDEILVTNTTDDLALTAREIRLLDQIVGTLLESAAKYIALRTYTEASQILLTVLERLHLCIDKYAVQQPDLADSLMESYELLLKLVHSDPAPALCDAIFGEGLRLLRKTYHQLPDAQFNLVPVLLETNRSASAALQIADMLETKLRTVDNPVLWAAWYLHTCKIADREADSDLLTNSLSGGQIFSAVTILEGLQGGEAADRIILKLFRQVELPARQGIQWLQRMLRYAQRAEDTALALECGLSLIAATGEVQIVDVLTDTLADHPEARRRLESALREHRDHHGLARLYAAEGNDAALLSLLRTTSSIELARAYLPDLLEYDREQAAAVAQSTLTHFALHHAGPACQENIQAFYAVLREAGESALVRKLRNVLSAEFPGRF